MNAIVLGLGFGDEGKGVVTSYLVSKINDGGLVVRFNGGQQAGHTVIKDNISHVFSNFGSGTLHRFPTFWSEFCTVSPTGIRNEYDDLIKNKFNPELFIDPLCPVTTPFDKFNNTKTEKLKNHGSCGVGFGSTLERHEKYYKLFYRDLFFPKILRIKLNNIRDYYKSIGMLESNWAEKELFFKKDIEFLIDNKIITQQTTNFQDYNNIIFEGAQGILLDMDFGFFPNVTRSNTTSKNIDKIVSDRNWNYALEKFYVSRIYQTRHGNGYMSSEENLDLLNAENETNVYNQYQGNFRKGFLDFNLLEYSLKCDDNFLKKNISKKTLVFTCCDQIEIPISIIDFDNKIRKVDTYEFHSVVETLIKRMGHSKFSILYNSSAEGKFINSENTKFLVNPLNSNSNLLAELAELNK